MLINLSRMTLTVSISPFSVAFLCAMEHSGPELDVKTKYLQITYDEDFSS